MKKYSDTEKRSIIEHYITNGESLSSIFSDTGIPKSTFYNWIKSYKAAQNAAGCKEISLRNFHLLENKVVRLEGIIEILKTVECTPQAPLKQKLYAAEKLYGKYNVHMICDALDISRGTVYNHVFRNKIDNTCRKDLRCRTKEK